MTDPGGSPPPFAGLALVVSIDDEGWEGEGLGDIEALLADAIRTAARRAELPDDLETELSVTLTSDAEVQVLNAEWRGKDKPTNVLSFPMADLQPGETPGPMLGDLVMARETLLREAAAEGKRLSDHFRHLAVHGFLHCLGFDHVEPEDAEEMEALEVEILADLGIADPYALADRLDEGPAQQPGSDDRALGARERWVAGR